MARDKFEQQLRTFVKNTLRRASLRWQPRTDAFTAARIERGLYQCKMCKEGFKRDQVILDHINPVVPITGSDISIEEWIRGLLVPAEGFQVLCKTCSDAKTFIEDKMRAKANQKKKELDKAKKKE